MSRNYFGTDGIRGETNTHPMTPEIAMRVGMAAGRHFVRGDHRHRVVIGKDTRLSGYTLEPALVSGFAATGMDVILVGPMPTPAVAMLTQSLRADIGVMLSASHNPYQDNGIKLFGPDGYKLSDDAEMEIERRIDREMGDLLVAPPDLGRVKRLEDETGRYVEYVKQTFPSALTLDGLKVVVDCANGAAYKVAPSALWELGAEVIPIGVSPNGFNINDACGSTHPHAMCNAVREHGAHLGIALDGDADRVIVADEKGTIIDGDQIMALIAESWSRRGVLTGGGIVATVMSNLGLEHYLDSIGLHLNRAPVGDRYVVQKMRDGGYNIGGEQSGHIVMSKYMTTGDGLLAALQVLVELVRAEKPASELLNLFQTVPQLLRNVRYNGGDPLASDSVQAAIRDGESRLAESGRLLIRKSGTEPLIRVMAEGEDEALVEAVVSEICATVEQVA